MSAVLEGKYLTVVPMVDINVHPYKGLGFAIQSKYLMDCYENRTELHQWEKEYYACVCFIYPDKNNMEIKLHDNQLNTVSMYDEVKDPIDVYELTMEYVNCVDFARQACLDTLEAMEKVKKENYL